MVIEPLRRPAEFQPGCTIASVQATIVDVPTLRRHQLSSLSVTAQSYVIVELQLANGVIGIGEAATLGGPRWSEESVESIKATIDTYLVPVIIGQRADCFELVGKLMDAAAKRNTAAKAAIETALLDAVGKTFNLPAAALLGGVVRDSIPVFWTLASGDASEEIEEAEKKLAGGLHNRFKIKVGAQSADDDLARVARLATALTGRAQLIVDANQAWDETTAVRCLPVLEQLGIKLVEQPLSAWNIRGMARLRSRFNVPLMADESVFSANDMSTVASEAAADVVSLKLVKHGGLFNTRKVAAVAEAAGIGLYGGCLLESSIGAAAHLQVFAGLRDLKWGCEHFGPQLLVEDLVTEPLRFADFRIHLPAGPGIGVTVDRAKLQKFARH